MGQRANSATAIDPDYKRECRQCGELFLFVPIAALGIPYSADTVDQVTCNVQSGFPNEEEGEEEDFMEEDDGEEFVLTRNQVRAVFRYNRVNFLANSVDMLSEQEYARALARVKSGKRELITFFTRELGLVVQVGPKHGQ